jgi:hypothetical protein
MSNRIVIACILWISILTAAVMAGCSQEPPAARGQAELRGDDVLHDGFRIRRDAARNRIWVLGLDNVRVYDGRTKRLIQAITLPNWSVVRSGCDPDLVLDASGSAIVSSNVQPRLWRIDAGTFKLSEHPITLEGRERWDVGFGALAVNADGTLLALTSVSEFLWSIDLGKGSARVFTPTGGTLNLCSPRTRSSREAGGGLDEFTHFVPAAGSDYALIPARTEHVAAASGPDIAVVKGR